MAKLLTHKGILITLSVIFTIIASSLWAVQNNIQFKYIIVILSTILFLANSFAGIFTVIEQAKGVRGKILAGLLGNMLLNVLFLVALFYVVLIF
jgi:heme/copper-type cytochrome/quinol oxidase subunit 3